MSTKYATRECPFCKEEIKAEAVKCKFCQSSITPEKPAHEGVCPYCKEDIKPDAIRCKHCKSDLDPAATQKECHCESSNPVAQARRQQIGGGLPLTYCDEGGTMWCLGECTQNGCFYFPCGSCGFDFGIFDQGVVQQRLANPTPMTSGPFNSALSRRPQVTNAGLNNLCDANGTYWCVKSCGPNYCFYVPCGSCVPSVGSLGGVFRG